MAAMRQHVVSIVTGASELSGAQLPEIKWTLAAAIAATLPLIVITWIYKSLDQGPIRTLLIPDKWQTLFFVESARDSQTTPWMKYRQVAGAPALGSRLVRHAPMLAADCTRQSRSTRRRLPSPASTRRRLPSPASAAASCRACSASNPTGRQRPELSEWTHLTSGIRRAQY